MMEEDREDNNHTSCPLNGERVKPVTIIVLTRTSLPVKSGAFLIPLIHIRNISSALLFGCSQRQFF